MRKPLIFLFALLLILFVIGAVQIYADRRAEESLREVLSRLRVEGVVHYDSVSHSLLKGTTEVNGLRITSSEGSTFINRLVITRLTENDLELVAEGIEPDTPDFRGFLERMRELGYERVEVNARISVSLYDDRRELIVRRFDISVPSAFSMGFRLHADRVDSALLSALTASEEDEEAITELSERLGQVRVKSFELTLEDLGIRVRLLKKEAQRESDPVEEILRRTEEELNRSLREDPDLREEILSALGTFLREGGTLRLRADPIPPVDFQTLVLLALLAVQSGDFSEFAYRLNVKLKHLPRPSSG